MMKEFFSNTKTELIHILVTIIASVFLLSGCRTVKKNVEKSSFKMDSVSTVKRDVKEVKRSDSTGSTYKVDTSTSSVFRDYESFRTIETFQASELSPLLMRETIYSRGKELEQSRAGRTEFSESKLSRKDSTVAVEQSETKVSIKQDEVKKEKESKVAPGWLVVACAVLLVVNLLMNIVILKKTFTQKVV